ncbi:hypothetical protein RHS03_01645, partial [Rhizoctonia solani]
MSLSTSNNCWEAPKDDAAAKFIVIRPHAESKSSELFVSNNPGDGYNLTFQSLAEFEEWRQQEEEMYTIEFVRGDSHGSRSNPPRFKEHVKLVCARHSRRGRKQYVKKYPERIRKLPNRKIDGIGCPASICYKTYINTSIVRVMYQREHSHSIGPDNLPFTKKGRRILARRNHPIPRSLVTPSYSPSTSSVECSSPDVPSAIFPSHNSISSALPVYDIQSEDASYDQAQKQPLLERPFYPQHHELGDLCVIGDKEADSITQAAMYTPELDLVPGNHCTISRPPAHIAHSRWDRLAALFRSVHEHAASFEYPLDTLGELEDVLARLYHGSNIGEDLFHSQEVLGLNMTGRGAPRGACANDNEEPTQPSPVGNTYIPGCELSGQEACSHAWYSPDLEFTYCAPHALG